MIHLLYLLHVQILYLLLFILLFKTTLPLSQLICDWLSLTSRRFVRRVEILCLLKLWAWDDHICDVIDPRVDIIVWRLCFWLTGLTLIFTGFTLIRNYTTVTEYKWQKMKKVSLMYLWEIYRLFKSLPKDLQRFLLANSLEFTVRFLLSLFF